MNIVWQWNGKELVPRRLCDICEEIMEPEEGEAETRQTSGYLAKFHALCAIALTEPTVRTCGVGRIC